VSGCLGDGDEKWEMRREEETSNELGVRGYYSPHHYLPLSSPLSRGDKGGFAL